MTKLFKFMKDGKVVGVSYSNINGNITPPEGATAVEITEDEKAAAIAQQQADMPTPFNPDLIMQGVFNIFQNNLVIMGPYAGTLGLLMQYQNWAGLSALRDQLVSANIITQDEANQLTALFAAQGITLP